MASRAGIARGNALKALGYTRTVLLQGTAAVTDSAGRWWKWTERLPAPMRVPLRSSFVRFLLVGGLNTVFGYCVYAMFILATVPYPIAIFLSTSAGILFNFKTYGALIFGSHDNRKILRFIAVYGFCYALNLVALGWLRVLGVSLLAGGAILAIPMAAVAYLLNRRFVFPARAS